MNLADLIWGNNHEDLSWLDEGACIRVKDPDIFFPPRDKKLYRVISAEAKKYCFGDDERPACPVRTQCLLYAINFDEGKGEQHGIWGGMSHRERNALVRKWQKQYKSSMTLPEYIESLEKRDK